MYFYLLGREQNCWGSVKLNGLILGVECLHLKQTLPTPVYVPVKQFLIGNTVINSYFFKTAYAEGTETRTVRYAFNIFHIYNFLRHMHVAIWQYIHTFTGER